MATSYYLKSGGGAVARANSTAYTLGNIMVIARADTSTNYAVTRKWVFECTTAGTSGAAVPTWSASYTQDVTTVTDGTVVWTARKPGYSSGSTANWGWSAIYLDYVVTAMAAGDTLYISSAHSEANLSSQSQIVVPGTITTPCYLLTVSDAAAPPTALASYSSFTDTSTGGAAYLNGSFYAYGLYIKWGSGSNNVNYQLHLGGHVQYFDTCKFEAGSIQNGFLYIGTFNSTAGGACYFRNVNFKSNVAGIQYPYLLNGNFYWEGGTITSNSASATNIIALYGNSGSYNPINTEVVLSGLDLSSLPAGTSIVPTSGTQTSFKFLIRNCKLPASWSGSLAPTNLTPGIVAQMVNCDSGATTYRHRRIDYFTDIREETTLVRTGGASDGTTTLSWKMVSSSKVSWPQQFAVSDEIFAWVDTTGASKTVSIEILHDSATNLKDNEVWIDVQYLGNASYPLASYASDRTTDIMTTAADQTASSATWTTTGMTNPNKQTLSVSLTPGLKGPIVARVMLAKASKTIYVDPLLTVA